MRGETRSPNKLQSMAAPRSSQRNCSYLRLRALALKYVLGSGLDHDNAAQAED